MSPTTRAWLQIHFCVVLWGFTAILGKVISLQAFPLVWWRMTLVAGALLLFKGFWTGLAGTSPKLVATFAGIGVIISLHWLTFYASIKLSNASVAATCMAFAPVLISLVDPIITRRRLNPHELLVGLAVIPGVALVVGGTPVEMRPGIAMGALSALLVAVFASLNKLYLEYGEALSITGIEMGSGALFLAVLSLFLPRMEGLLELPSRHDALLLIVLALGCTLLPFALSLVAQRHLSAFATTLAVNMEPVYAILLAIVLLGEQRELDGSFYAGVGIILGTIFTYPVLARSIARRDDLIRSTRELPTGNKRFAYFRRR
jgi:drug/metabolite transporter (DMT)-like permease